MPVPSEMTFVEVAAPGGAEMLRPARGPTPRAGRGEVLIRVAAAGVNRPDVFQRMGAYPMPPGANPILGLEVAGTVEALGEGATGFRIGDQVCALTNGGGYAQYCAVPAAQCLPSPHGYDAVAAASLPETYFTVWANLVQLGQLKAGESVLVHGGSSGIGVSAIQLAKALGATVYATAGSAEKCEACVSLGASAAFNYREVDFAAEVARVTEGRGVDIILDMVGAPYFERNLSALAMDGRLVLIAFLQGSKVEAADLMPLMMRRLSVTGSTMRARTAAQKAAIAHDLRETVWPLLEAGLCAPVVHATYPLAKAAEAHRLMESSQHIGKIILEV